MESTVLCPYLGQFQMASNQQSSHTSADLAHRARSSQDEARRRPARPEDSFLVDEVLSRPSPGQPNGVLPFSNSLHGAVCGFLKAKQARESGEGPHESEIRRVLSAQKPTESRRFQIGSVSASDTLPGRAPLVDHLYVRAMADPDWRFIDPALMVARNNRCPSLTQPPLIRELTLGQSTPAEVDEAISFLKTKCKDVRRVFFFCQLAGDVEAISIPQAQWADIKSRVPGETVHLDLAASGESGHKLPVRFMFGHVGWEIHLRLPILEGADPDYPKRLSISPGELQPGVQKLIEAAGSLAGVNIGADISEFNEVIRAFYCTQLNFRPPVELQPLARLAGYNLTRYAVDALCWVTLGGILPKGLCSIGDGRWHQPWPSLPASLQAYLSADIGQVALIFWCLLAAWLMNLFPDLHAVVKVSRFASGADLVVWWYDMVVLRQVIHLRSPHNWLRADSRKTIIDAIASGTSHHKELKQLLPDWPSVTAGGCRYFHTARAFLVELLPVLRGFGGRAWPGLYREQLHIVRLSRRTVLAQPSPVEPVTSSSLQPNPGVGEMLRGPASQLTRSCVKAVVIPGVCTRSVLLEFIRSDPRQGQALLQRLESSRKAAEAILCLSKKVGDIIQDVREMLHLFQMMPTRPSGWVDPFPPPNCVPRIQRDTEGAREVAVNSAKRGVELVKRSLAIKRAIAEAEEDPPQRLDHRYTLGHVLNRRGPGNPEDDDAVCRRMGTSSRHPADMRLADNTSGRTVRERSASPSTMSSGSIRPSCASPMSRSSSYSRTDISVIEVVDPVPQMAAVRPIKRIHYREYQHQRGYTTSEDLEPSPKRLYEEVSPSGIRSLHASASVGSRLSGRLGPPPSTSAGPLGAECGTGGRELGSTPQHPSELSVDIKQVLVIGHEQARRLSCSLYSTLPVPVSYVPLDASDARDYAAVSARLSTENLASTFIIIWCFDELCFVQQESGSPLEVSPFDLTAHCVGPLGTVSRPQLFKICEDSKQLLAICQRSVGSLLLTPLPRYLSASCCEDRTHCVGSSRLEVAEQLCGDLSSMSTAVQRWASEQGFLSTTVVCPHLEILQQQCTHPWVHWVPVVKGLFGSSTTHLTRENYASLASALWSRVRDRFSVDSGLRRSPGRTSVRSVGSVGVNPPTGIWSRVEPRHHHFDTAIRQRSMYSSTNKY